MAKGKADHKAKPAAARPIHPFDRQPDETTKAYSAFRLYRDMGAGRTLDKTRMTLGRPPGYMRQLETWSSRYGWVERTRAWDDAEARRKVVGDDPLDAALGLTFKQKAFAEAYIYNGGIGVRAAKAAGYDTDDYNTLAAIASGNLKLPKVRRYVDQLMRESAMSADEVLFQLSEIARGDMRGFIGLAPDKLKLHPKGNLIKKIEVTVTRDADGYTEEKTKLELYSRADALQQLGRYHKLFVDRVQVEDWRQTALELIRSGQYTFDKAVEEVGRDLATELFESIGVPITAT